jgi:outer membrane lipoprotein carrier protein
MAVVQRRTTVVRHCFVLLLGLGSSFALVSTSSADEIIQKVEKRYNEARSLSVNFVETYSLIGHPRPPESGELILRKQGKMRWEYSRPKGKLFVSDGRNVFLYTAEDNRVEKIPLKATEDMRAPLAFLLGHLDLKKEFKDFQIRDGDGGTWLDASAKSDRTPYTKIEMLVTREGEIRRLHVFGQDQSVISYVFSEEKLNPPAPDELFRFQIPAGAQVVNSAETGGAEIQ